MLLFDELVDLIEAVCHGLLKIGFTVFEYPDRRSSTYQTLFDELMVIEVDHAKSNLVVVLVVVVIQDSD